MRRLSCATGREKAVAWRRGTKKEPRFKLMPAGSIAGRVFDEDSNPVLVEVSPDNAADNGAGIRVGTDEKGFYHLDGLAPGRCRAEAAGTGIRLIRAPVDLDVVPQRNDNAELRFVESADLSGVVIFKTKVPSLARLRRALRRRRRISW